MSPCSDLIVFRPLVQAAKHVVILTGAGVSAESGVPTYRGPGGLYGKNFQDHGLQFLQKILKDPASIISEVRSYRRQFVETKAPNAAHRAIAKFEEKLQVEQRKVVVITQNVDDLHTRAGTKSLIQLHGSLFESRCLECFRVESDKFLGDASSSCTQCRRCGGYLRPNVVWFGEPLDKQVLLRADEELEKCDLCLLVGTSSLVYPAAKFAPQVAARGVPVAEFNLESTHATENFEGPCGTTLPPVFGFDKDADFEIPAPK